MKKNIITVFLIIALTFTLGSCNNSTPEGQTNVQESTVDEGDIVKMSDDGLIYNAQSDGVTVTQTNDGNMNVIAEHSADGYVPQEMYINGNYLITIGGKATEFNVGGLAAYNYYQSPYFRVSVNVFNMADIKAKSFGEEKVSLDDYNIYSFSIQGQYYTSRLFTETKELYLIFNYENYITFTNNSDIREREYNKNNVTYIENGENKTLTNIEEIKDLAIEHYDYDATLFVKINLSDEDITAVAKGYYGAKFQDLYMSENALYPVFLMYAPEKRAVCYNMHVPFTYMLKVSKTDLQAAYQAKITGYYVYDRYAIKDFGNVIYVCATNINKGSAVFAYDTNLSEIGKLEDIAPYEDVKSVNYQQTDGKTYCYITTYRQTDPLFKIDVTTPSDMKKLGELAVTGFATYLHPISEQFLIGIGYDGNQNSADQSKLKVSLYNVGGDQITPINYITISGVVKCEALVNEKAIAIDNDSMVFGFSVLRQIGSKYLQGYYVFNIENGELNGLIYITNFPTGIEDNFSYYEVFRNFISRAFIHEEYAYFVADSMIVSYSMISLSQGEKIPIDDISTIIE